MSNIIINFDNGELTLNGILNQHTVEFAMSQAIELLPLHQKIIVNLQHVTDCDSASLAFLMALLREAKKRNLQITFSHMSKQMHDLGRVCGIDSFL